MMMEVANLAAAARYAAQVFRSYEKLHRAKGTTDGEVKAALNQHEAEALEEALAAYDASLKRGAVVEAVAWQRRYIDPVEGPGLWSELREQDRAIIESHPEYEVRALYTTPPTPHVTTDTTDAAQGVCPYCGATLADGKGHYAECEKWGVPPPIPAEQQAASEGRRVVTDAEVERGLTAFYGINSQKYSLPANARRDMRAALESFAAAHSAGGVVVMTANPSIVYDSATGKAIKPNAGSGYTIGYPIDCGGLKWTKKDDS